MAYNLRRKEQMNNEVDKQNQLILPLICAFEQCRKKFNTQNQLFHHYSKLHGLTIRDKKKQFSNKFLYFHVNKQIKNSRPDIKIMRKVARKPTVKIPLSTNNSKGNYMYKLAIIFFNGVSFLIAVTSNEIKPETEKNFKRSKNIMTVSDQIKENLKVPFTTFNLIQTDEIHNLKKPRNIKVVIFFLVTLSIKRTFGTHDLWDCYFFYFVPAER